MSREASPSLTAHESSASSPPPLHPMFHSCSFFIHGILAHYATPVFQPLFDSSCASTLSTRSRQSLLCTASEVKMRNSTVLSSSAVSCCVRSSQRRSNSASNCRSFSFTRAPFFPDSMKRGHSKEVLVLPVDLLKLCEALGLSSGSARGFLLGAVSA